MAKSTQKKDSTVTEMVIKKLDKKNIRKSILEVDDLVNHHLELLDLDVSKEKIMKEAIKDINKSTNKKKIIKKTYEQESRAYLNSLNDHFKGKLFYIAYKDSNKYLSIKDIEKVVDKKTLLGFVKEIEVGQEYAWSLIDNLKNEKLRDFLYGIFTYIYF